MWMAKLYIFNASLCSIHLITSSIFVKCLGFPTQFLYSLCFFLYLSFKAFLLNNVKMIARIYKMAKNRSVRHHLNGTK